MQRSNTVYIEKLREERSKIKRLLGSNTYIVDMVSTVKIKLIVTMQEIKFQTYYKNLNSPWDEQSK